MGWGATLSQLACVSTSEGLAGSRPRWGYRQEGYSGSHNLRREREREREGGGGGGGGETERER